MISQFYIFQILIIVITSYSIHYTKLYDIGKTLYELSDVVPKEYADIYTKKDEELFNRITSYNVCYTKLLRFSSSI